MTKHRHLWHHFAAIAVFLCESVTVSAQTGLKTLIPTIRKEMKGAYSEQYVRTDGNISYSIFTETLPKDSFPAYFQQLLRSTANKDMEQASEADHYITNEEGKRTETFTLRNDSLNMKAQLTLGDKVYFLFSENIPSPGNKENLSVSLDKYLEDNFGMYRTKKHDIETNFVEFISPDGNSKLTPVYQRTYSIPANMAAKANLKLRQLLRDKALSTDYGKIYLLRRNVQINYTTGRNADVYYFMPQSDGSMDITKFDIIDKDVKKKDNNVVMQEPKGKNLIMKPSGEYYDTWNLPVADKPLPEEVDLVFTLERRSDETIMHIRKRIYDDALETWTDDAQTFLVDEETQVHYMARSCTPKEIWGKMIRVMDMQDKTIAIDVYFPPLPSGVHKFSVWGLRRFGVPTEHIFYMKRDGDLYFAR